MKVYKVGGAIRDKLLGYPHTENDWVVVGSSPGEMLASGFTPVGKQFPVFLHPETREEYALARTEKKQGHGYQGFTFNTSPGITLEEDLYRRDLTINAIAEDDEGNIIDPYQGKLDLENKILRHVSASFTEDPVRVLRVARFAARYHHLGFTVADETLQLMKQITKEGEIDHLVPERVWQELVKTLGEKTPGQFFKTLKACDALAVIFPEINNLFGVPQRKDYHPEVDTGIHTLLSLEQAVLSTNDKRVRFATLVHDLGKAETPEDVLPRHIGHEKRSLPLIMGLCDRLTVPNDYRQLALIVAEHHTLCHKAPSLKAKTLHKVLKVTGALGNNSNLDAFLTCCEADARGRTGLENQPYPQPEYFRNALAACQTIKTAEIIGKGFSGEELGAEIKRQQIAAISTMEKPE